MKQVTIEELIYGVRQQKEEYKVNKYASIPQVVTAIQWNGQNLMKIHRFLGEDTRIKCSIDLLAINGDIIVPLNHYIIKHEDGDLMICPQKTFMKRYIPAEVKG